MADKTTFDRITSKMVELVEELQRAYPEASAEINRAWDAFIIPADEAVENIERED